MLGSGMRVVRDRRSSLRVLFDSVDGPEVFVYTERDRIEGRCVDLSMGGMLVHSTWPTYTRRLVTIEAFFGEERLRLDAELCRHEEVSEGHALAFRFVDLNPRASASLWRVIGGRLDESSQRDYARAFMRGAYGEPAMSTGSGGDVVSPAGGGQPVAQPVISGLTEAIAVDPPASRVHTQIATPAPSPRVMGGVRFDASWEEDEGDTARFRRLVEEVGPGHTVRLGPDGTPLPPEQTAIVHVDALRPSVEGEGASAPDSGPPTEPLPDSAAPSVGPGVDRQEREAGSPELIVAEHTLPIERSGATVSLTAGQPHSHSVEEPAEPASDGPPTLPMRLGGRPVSTEPVPPPLLRGPAQEAVPERSGAAESAVAVTSTTVVAPTPSRPSAETRPERLGAVGPSTAVAAAAAPTMVPFRPSQRALLDARALLRPPPRLDKRRPRVIVSIPHTTYRPRSRSRRR